MYRYKRRQVFDVVCIEITCTTAALMLRKFKRMSSPYYVSNIICIVKSKYRHSPTARSPVSDCLQVDTRWCVYRFRFPIDANMVTWPPAFGSLILVTQLTRASHTVASVATIFPPF